jgi:hypothetical protein
MTLRDLRCFRLLRSVSQCPYCPFVSQFLLLFLCPFHDHAIPSTFRVFWPTHIPLRMFDLYGGVILFDRAYSRCFYSYVFPILRCDMYFRRLYFQWIFSVPTCQQGMTYLIDPYLSVQAYLEIACTLVFQIFHAYHELIAIISTHPL